MCVLVLFISSGEEDDLGDSPSWRSSELWCEIYVLLFVVGWDGVGARHRLIH